VVVVGVVVVSRQVPFMLEFCCSQSFVRLRQCLRCAACVFRQHFFSAFVPVHSLFGGTSARQLLMSCWQSLRQWLACAAATPASIRTKPSVATAGTARNLFWVIRSKIINARPGAFGRVRPDRALRASIPTWGDMRLSRTWGDLPGSQNLQQLPFQGGQEGENENGPPGCEELPQDRCAEERRTAIDRGSSEPNSWVALPSGAFIDGRYYNPDQRTGRSSATLW